MENIQILNLDFNIANKNLPINIYAIRVFDCENNKTFDLLINHDGTCPNIFTEREQSRYNDYLSNLEYKLIDEFYKTNKIKKPKKYYSKIELMTDSKGNLFHLTRSID